MKEYSQFNVIEGNISMSNAELLKCTQSATVDGRIFKIVAVKGRKMNSCFHRRIDQFCTQHICVLEDIECIMFLRNNYTLSLMHNFNAQKEVMVSKVFARKVFK